MVVPIKRRVERDGRAFLQGIPKWGLARVDPALVKSMLGVPLVTDGHVGSSLIISPPCTFLSAPNIKLTTD